MIFLKEILVRVPRAHGKACFAHGKGFAVCCTRQAHIANRRQQRGFLSCAIFGHTAKSLPYVKKHSENHFLEK